MPARLEMIWPATVDLSSNSSAMLLAIAVLVMALPFIAFIGAMLQSAKGGRRKSTSYTTKCYTEPVIVSTYKASDVTSEVPYTEEQKQSHVETRTTEVPRDITTSMPYPETKYVTKYKHVTKEVTKPAGEKCETQTTCETKTMGGHGGRGGWGGKGKGGKGWD